MINAFRFCRCVGSLQCLWYSWVNCTFPGLVVVGPAMLVHPGVGVQSLLSQVHSTTFVLLVLHSGACNSRNRFRMSSTGEELSKYSADDQRGARAVSKLGVVGPEVGGNSSGSHPPLVQQVLHQQCELLQSLCELWRRPREKFSMSNVTAITFRHFAASPSSREPCLTNFPMLRIGVLTFVTLNSACTQSLSHALLSCVPVQHRPC